MNEEYERLIKRAKGESVNIAHAITWNRNLKALRDILWLIDGDADVALSEETIDRDEHSVLMGVTLGLHYVLNAYEG